MATFLHTADLHLGQGGGEALPPELARIREREIKASLTRIVDLALAREVDLLLVAGDLFTDRFASPSLLRFANSEFARLGKRVLLSAGNHDPLFPQSPAQVFPWHENVFFFPPDGFQQLVLAELDLAVTGLSWGRERPGEEQLLGLPEPASDLFNIALLHGSAGDAASLADDYFPLPTEKLVAAGYDYIALGHYHRPNRWQVGKTFFAYPGSPEPLGFGEPGQHGVWLGDTSGNLALEFLPLSEREYQTMKWDLSGVTGEGELLAKLTEALAGKEQDLVRLTLTGTLPSGFSLDSRSIGESLQELVFFLQLADETQEEVSLEDYPPGSLRRLFSQRILGELEETPDPTHRRKLELALKYGLGALIEGKVEVGGVDFDY